MFTSSRNHFAPNGDGSDLTMQLYVMDDDGKNLEQIGHLNLGSALHPTSLTDGRVMFSSLEGQGARDLRLWGLWGIRPDGRTWEPLLSAFPEAFNVFHFQTQKSDRFSFNWTLNDPPKKELRELGTSFVCSVFGKNR